MKAAARSATKGLTFLGRPGRRESRYCPRVTADPKILLEIDGPGVTPATVDSVATLELAAAYFALLHRVAEEQGTDLRFTGVSIEDKCVAVAVHVQADETAVRRAANDAGNYLRGELPPYGLDTLTKRVAKMLRGFPAGHSAKVIVGGWRRRLELTTSTDGGAESVSELRVDVLRVGGLQPTARLASKSEPQEFTVSLPSRAVARDLAGHLYGEIDATVRLRRDEDGTIESGVLESFVAVADEDPVKAWRAWFKTAGGDWGSVSDVEGELDGV
jgi:hypothetical protein